VAKKAPRLRELIPVGCNPLPSVHRDNHRTRRVWGGAYQGRPQEKVFPCLHFLMQFFKATILFKM